MSARDRRRHTIDCPAGDPDQTGDSEVWPCECGLTDARREERHQTDLAAASAHAEAAETEVVRLRDDVRDWELSYSQDTGALQITIDELRADIAAAGEEIDRLRDVVRRTWASRSYRAGLHVAQLTRERDTAMADLNEETALRTALRTQESRISGILADAGVPVGDLVRGVEVLVKERDEARDTIEAQNAHTESLYADCARMQEERDALRATLAALEDGRHEDLPALVASTREAALREAAHLFTHRALYHGGEAITRILTLLDKGWE